MSLYRETGRRSARTLIIAALVTLLVGGAIGFAIGRSSAPEPSLGQIRNDLAANLKPVRNGLVLLPNEYAQAYKGEGVESKGVTGALDRIEKQLIKVAPDLRALNPRAVERLDIAFDALKKSVQQKAAPGEVQQRVDAVSNALEPFPS